MLFIKLFIKLRGLYIQLFEVAYLHDIGLHKCWVSSIVSVPVYGVYQGPPLPHPGQGHRLAQPGG
jgi:hypothetical protein